MNGQYHDICFSVNKYPCFTQYKKTCTIDEMNTTLAQRLIRTRTEAGLKQTDFVEGAGVSQQTISNLEKGIQKTSTDIVAIAIRCGVRPEWLDSESGPMRRNEMIVEDPKIIEALRVMQKLPDYLFDAEILRLQTLATLANSQKDEHAIREAVLAERKKWESEHSLGPGPNPTKPPPLRYDGENFLHDRTPSTKKEEDEQ